MEEEKQYRGQLRTMVNSMTDLNESLLDRIKQLKAYITRAGLEVPSPDAGLMAPIVALNDPGHRISSKRLRTGLPVPDREQSSTHIQYTQESIPWTVLEGRDQSHYDRLNYHQSVHRDQLSHPDESRNSPRADESLIQRHPFAEPLPEHNEDTNVSSEVASNMEDDDIEEVEVITKEASYHPEEAGDRSNVEVDIAADDHTAQSRASDRSSFEEVATEDYLYPEMSVVEPQSESISLSRIEEEDDERAEMQHSHPLSDGNENTEEHQNLEDVQYVEEPFHQEDENQNLEVEQAAEQYEEGQHQSEQPMTNDQDQNQAQNHDESNKMLVDGAERTGVAALWGTEAGIANGTAAKASTDHSSQIVSSANQNVYESLPQEAATEAPEGFAEIVETVEETELPQKPVEDGNEVKDHLDVSSHSSQRLAKESPKPDQKQSSNSQISEVQNLNETTPSRRSRLSLTAANHVTSPQRSPSQSSPAHTMSSQRASSRNSSLHQSPSERQVSKHRPASDRLNSHASLPSQSSPYTSAAQRSSSRSSLSHPPDSNAPMSSAHEVSLTDLVESAERDGTKEGKLPSATMELIMKNERLIQQRFEGLQPPASLMRSISRITGNATLPPSNSEQKERHESSSRGSQSLPDMYTTSMPNTSADEVVNKSAGTMLPENLPGYKLPSSRPEPETSMSRNSTPQSQQSNASSKTSSRQAEQGERQVDRQQSDHQQKQPDVSRPDNSVHQEPGTEHSVHRVPSPLKAEAKSSNNTTMSESSVPNLRAIFESTPARKPIARSSNVREIRSARPSLSVTPASRRTSGVPSTRNSVEKTSHSVSHNTSRRNPELSLNRSRSRNPELSSAANQSESTRTSLYMSALSSFGDAQGATSNRSVSAGNRSANGNRSVSGNRSSANGSRSINGNRSVEFRSPQSDPHSISTHSANGNESDVLKDIKATRSPPNNVSGDLTPWPQQTPENRSNTSHSASESTLTPSFTSMPGAWPRNSFKPIAARPATTIPPSVSSSATSSPLMKDEQNLKSGLRKRVKTRKVYQVQNSDESLPDMSQLPHPDDTNEPRRRYSSQ